MAKRMATDEDDEKLSLFDDDGFDGTDDDKRRRGARRPLVIIGALFLVLVLGGVAVAGWYLSRVNTALDDIERGPQLPTNYPGQPERADDYEAQNIVLMGSDDRYDGGGGRSDSLIVLHLSGDGESAYLVSFPRDLWVPIPDHGTAKINAAYAYGGPQLTVKTMEQLLDTRIDHTAEIDFAGFIALTDTLGGVTVNNKVESSWKEYHFPRGELTLKDGKEALVYVRQRKELPNGDLDRAERQRAVIKAIISKAASPETLTNPGKFSSMVGDMSRHITVDETLTTEQIRSLALDSKIRSGSQIKSLQAPITGFEMSSDGQSIAVVDEPAMAELAKALQNDTMDEYAKKHPN
ncbi:LCP family protein [Propioniferax innocua]|uniref:LytR family transcriptional attenuator n=1 Tax=Propioniferax innocua TaxID=1753 RepID=A0A542ZSQ3_9ACTN|nr:LCP family protein [Propioniferax innocua]TQL63384.1 LytR family transcriptional attenuator [Propioniferax innocua]